MAQVAKSAPHKTKKTIGKTTFCDMGIPHSPTLINHVVYCDFYSHFGEMTRKSVKIPLGFSLFRDVVLQFCKTIENHCQNNVSRQRENMFKIPYKTCRLLTILGSFPQKGSKKDQNTIRFFTTGRMGFRRAAKPYKTLGN